MGGAVSDKEVAEIEAAWEKYWNENRLATKFGERRTFPGGGRN